MNRLNQLIEQARSLADRFWEVPGAATLAMLGIFAVVVAGGGLVLAAVVGAVQ